MIHGETGALLPGGVPDAVQGDEGTGIWRVAGNSRQPSEVRPVFGSRGHERRWNQASQHPRLPETIVYTILLDLEREKSG